MNFFKNLLFIITIFSNSISLNAQFDFIDFDKKISFDFTECAAIFHNDKLLVDTYNPNGKCKLVMGMKGELSLSTIELSGKSIVPIKNISFYVVIKNIVTNTLYLYTKKPVTKILIEDLFNQCNIGDNIIILTDDKKYNLTHHEIEVMGGC